MHAGLDLLRSELEGFDESASVIVISMDMAKMIGQIFGASESAIEILNDLLNYEHIDAGIVELTSSCGSSSCSGGGSGNSSSCGSSSGIG